MENLKNIIKEIQSYREELGLKSLSDDMLMDCATRIFNSQNIEISKNPIRQPKLKEASDKQIKFLKKLGYNGDNPLSSIEANKLIKELSK